MIQLDEFTAEWLKDLNETVRVLGACELVRLYNISTIRTEGEKETLEQLEELLPKLSKYSVEEVKDGESIED